MRRCRDGVRFYRRLLRLLPAAFRAEAERDLVAVFAAGYARVREEGLLRRAGFWTVIVVDILATAVAERRRPHGRARVTLRTLLTGVAYDLRLSIRRLSHRPGWTVLSAGTLALGLAATIVAVVLVRDILLKPLPFPRSDRLVRILERSDNGRGWWPSYPNAADWREQGRFFEGVGIADIPQVRPVIVNGSAVRVSVSRAGRGLFETLGITPVVGRLFTNAENAAGGAPVALISESFWRGSLAARPLETLVLGIRDRQYAVVGVLPAAFRFLGDGAAWSEGAAVWTPMDQDANLGGRTSHGYHVVARLRDGTTLQQARSDMNALVARIKATNREPTNADSAVLVPLQDVVVRQAREPLRWLLYASLAVLFVACLNLAAAILAQGLRRARELSIRLALGASRARLVLHLLSEATTLSLPAVAAGLGLAAGALISLRAIAAASLPRLDEARMDGTIVLLAVVAALVSGLLAGTAPALLLASRPFLDRLRTHGSSSSSGQRRLWPAFIVIQVALSMLLLTGTGLLIRSFVAAITVDLGYNPHQVLAVDVTLPESSYTEDARKVVFYDSALQRLRATPGVVAAAITSVLPQDTSAFTASTMREGTESESTFAGYRLIDPEYFDALAIRRISMDTAAFEAGGAIVDRTLQTAIWHGSSPIGDRFKNSFADRTMTVVGVVGPVREWDQDTDTIGAVYVDFHTRPSRIGTMHFVVRYAGREDAAAAAVRRSLGAVDPLVPVTIEPLQERVTASVAGRRFLTVVAATFGAIAVVLASIGVYALVAFAVARNARDTAIRLALGARPGAVRFTAASHGLAPALGGVLLGALGSVWLGSALRAQLFHVRAHDPWVLATAAVAVFAAALVAATLPARRASRVDPADILRAD